MPNLFVALSLPDDVTAELAALQPPPVGGVRLVKPGQMHLTLHYLGKVPVERTALALEAVTAAACSLAIEGVGQFPAADGATTLWAGVEASAALLELHAVVARALADVGFRPESRPYTPHITLARCGPAVPAHVVDEFLARHARFALPAVNIVEFGLYTSTVVADVPVYRCERRFALRDAGTA